MKQKGFIRVTSRGGNQAAVYQMISRIQDHDTNGALAGDKQPVNQASLLHEDGQDTDVVVSENTNWQSKRQRNWKIRCRTSS